MTSKDTREVYRPCTYVRDLKHYFDENTRFEYQGTVLKTLLEFSEQFYAEGDLKRDPALMMKSLLELIKVSYIKTNHKSLRKTWKKLKKLDENSMMDNGNFVKLKTTYNTILHCYLKSQNHDFLKNLNFRNVGNYGKDFDIIFVDDIRKMVDLNEEQWNQLIKENPKKYVAYGKTNPMKNVIFKGCSNSCKLEVTTLEADLKNLLMSKPGWYATCSCSSWCGLLKRLFNVTEQPEKGIWKDTSVIGEKLIPSMFKNLEQPFVKDEMEWAEQSNSKRALKIQACLWRQHNDVERHHADVNPKVKQEPNEKIKVDENGTSKTRNYFPRSTEFNNFGHRLYYLEKAFYKMTFNGIPCIAKCMPTSGKHSWAEYLYQMYTKFPHFLGCDQKSFESHVSGDALLYCYDIEDRYCGLYEANNLRKAKHVDENGKVPEGFDPKTQSAPTRPEQRLMFTIREVFESLGKKTKKRVTYMQTVLDRCLMSGDFDTAFIGVLLSVTLCLACMTTVKRPDGSHYTWEIEDKGDHINIVSDDFTFFDNGDDIGIFTKWELTAKDRKKLISEYGRYGFKLVIESSTNNFWNIEFCRSTPSMVKTKEGDRFYMIRDLARIIPNSLCTCRKLETHVALCFFYVKFYCAQLEYDGHPLGEFYKYLCNRLMVEIKKHYGSERTVREKIKKQLTVMMRDSYVENKLENLKIYESSIWKCLKGEPFTINYDIPTNDAIDLRALLRLFHTRPRQNAFLQSLVAFNARGKCESYIFEQ